MRHFTRADVEAFTRKMHQVPDGFILDIKSIAVLENGSETLPIWVVSYTVDRPEPRHEPYVLVDILTEGQFSDGLHLWPLIAQDIPIGYASVAAEDAAMNAAREERLKEHQS